MSVFEINYHDLSSAAKCALRVSDELDDYQDAITKRILAKLDNLPGNDNAGYAAAARSAAYEKKISLSQKKPGVLTLKSDIERLIEKAQETDNRASERITQLAEPYKTTWSLTTIPRKVSGFFYNLFCVDLANSQLSRFLLGEAFINNVRQSHNRFSHWREDVQNYFKHDDGRYIKNIAVSALKVIGTAILITAVAGTGLLAVIAVVAGGIYLVTQMSNFMVTTEDNILALQESQKGNKELAHYYGGTKGVTDWQEKRDFGSSSTNLNIKEASIIFEGVEKTSKVVFDIATIATAFDKLSNIYGLDGKVVDHDYSWSNIRRNMQRQLYENRINSGISYKYPGTDPMTEAKTSFNPFKFIFRKEEKLIGNLSSNDYVKNAKAIKSISERCIDFWTGEKSSTIKSIETINNFITEPDKYDVAKFVSSVFSLSGIGGISEYTGSYVDPYTGFGKDLSDLIKIGASSITPAAVGNSEVVW